MWLTDGFLVTFFGSWRGGMHTHMNLHTATVPGNNVQGGGSQTSENLKIWKNLNLNLGGREH